MTVEALIMELGFRFKPFSCCYLGFDLLVERTKVSSGYVEGRLGYGLSLCSFLERRSDRLREI